MKKNNKCFCVTTLPLNWKFWLNTACYNDDMSKTDLEIMIYIDFWKIFLEGEEKSAAVSDKN